VLIYGKVTVLETFLHIRHISDSQSISNYLIYVIHFCEDGVSTFLRNVRKIIILHSVKTPKTLI